MNLNFRSTVLDSTDILPIDRLNYILWVQDLLDTTSDECLDQYNPDRDVIGLDMYVPAVFKGAPYH